jgi:hypothetical protein
MEAIEQAVGGLQAGQAALSSSLASLQGLSMVTLGLTALDAEAAKATLFGGLVASGWHTAAITRRLLVQGGLPIAGGIIGAGGEITWFRSTRGSNPGLPNGRKSKTCRSPKQGRDVFRDRLW